MMKDATVSARVQSDIKAEAEEIIKNLGIPVSVVINSLYRQIIYKHGVPFELTVPAEPSTMDALSKAELISTEQTQISNCRQRATISPPSASQSFSG